MLLSFSKLLDLTEMLLEFAEGLPDVGGILPKFAEFVQNSEIMLKFALKGFGRKNPR